MRRRKGKPDNPFSSECVMASILGKVHKHLNPVKYLLTSNKQVHSQPECGKTHCESMSETCGSLFIRAYSMYKATIEYRKLWQCMYVVFMYVSL